MNQSTINQGGISKCCSAPIKADCDNGDERYCHFVCQKCFKKTDIKAPNKQQEWEKEFDNKSNPDNYELGEYHKLKNAENSLLDLEWYPESPYELDGDKIKDFISSLLAQQRNEFIKEIEEDPKTFRIEIGLGAYKNGKDDYTGKVGYVYFCHKCCNDWRIQFFSMGNNELLRDFNLSNCKIFFTENQAIKKVGDKE